MAKARGRLADDLINQTAPEMRRLWASGRWTSLMRRPHGGGAQARLGVSGREIDETIAKAQTWLDRAASMWEIEGLSMEDGWRVGGWEDGAAGLIGNRLTEPKLEKWLRVVDSFACYPGPRMISCVEGSGVEGYVEPKGSEWRARGPEFATEGPVPDAA